MSIGRMLARHPGDGHAVRVGRDARRALHAMTRPRAPYAEPSMTRSIRLLAATLLLSVSTPHASHAQAPKPLPAPASTEQQYTILIYETPAALATRTSAAADAYWNAYDIFAGELAKAGVLRGGSALDESMRTTVRGSGTADAAVRGARLGGYFVIAAPDRATAEAWARKAPPRAVAVEVRPHRANPHMAAMSMKD